MRQAEKGVKAEKGEEDRKGGGGGGISRVKGENESKWGNG